MVNIQISGGPKFGLRPNLVKLSAKKMAHFGHQGPVETVADSCEGCVLLYAFLT